ncbi:MAG TPA: hypothetical protein VEU95_08795 [Micropepsaceae bacterium]|nr:hypothetical protein [Micropepsaceae bacterium]
MFRFAIQVCGIAVLISAASSANSASAIPTIIIGGIEVPARGAPAGAASARPDFAPSGSVSWIRIGEAEFKPPLRGPGPVVSDPAHPTISNDDYRRTGKQPTFPVADLSNPILQPWVREQLRKRNADVLAGKPGFGPQQSCWPRGVPGFLLYGVQPLYIVQGARDVLMTWQGDHQVRHIYLDVPHAQPTKPSWYGDSIGHYEGDSLWVDTVGLNAKTYVDGFLTPHTERLHVVERFHLIDGGKTLEVNVHVEDPGAFTTPWDAVQRYRRVEPATAENALVVPNDGTTSAGLAGPMLESSCAENNNSYFGNDALPIPQASTPDF